jgi:tRNA/tmRNA/rRNA uracil-C5-methylase (TrmA/RlmC/RlmD family)
LDTQIIDIVKKSPIEIEHPTNKYSMSGGWKWINIPYQEQLKIKQEQLKESLNIIIQKQENLLFLPIIASPIID